MPSDNHPLAPRTLLVQDLDDCQSVARSLAASVARRRSSALPLVIGLVGTLGAGKTQWTKFFAQALGAEPDDVSSPTYVLIHRYNSEPVIHHVDAYRVKDPDEFLELGVEELFDGPQITIVEWADRFRDLMPDSTVWITIELDATHAHRRTITIENLPSALAFSLDPPAARGADL